MPILLQVLLPMMVFDYVGAEIGGGVSYNVSSNVWMTVGFTRNIDTDWDEENSFYLNTTFVY